MIRDLTSPTARMRDGLLVVNCRNADDDGVNNAFWAVLSINDYLSGFTSTIEDYPHELVWPLQGLSWKKEFGYDTVVSVPEAVRLKNSVLSLGFALPPFFSED